MPPREVLTEDEARVHALLAASLSVAVPLWIERARSWDGSKRAERQAACAQYVAEHGDVILFRAVGTAQAFNRLAEGLALLAFAPGGVTFAGGHWEAK